ncbi:hypothetical protein C8R46DRAFT_1365689 [Mycena filopes]|nr:hypothetical protein C8R46DRAFT_1365689 [Mycena filopes]
MGGLDGLWGKVANGGGKVDVIPPRRQDIDMSTVANVFGSVDAAVLRLARAAPNGVRLCFESRRGLECLLLPRRIAKGVDEAQETLDQRTRHTVNHETARRLRATTSPDLNIQIYFSIGENDDTLGDIFAFGCAAGAPTTLPRAVDGDLFVKAGNEHAEVWGLRLPHPYLVLDPFLEAISYDVEAPSAALRKRHTFYGLSCLARLSKCDASPTKSILADFGVTRMEVWSVTPQHVARFSQCAPDLVTGRYADAIVDQLIKDGVVKANQRNEAVRQVSWVEEVSYEKTAALDIKDTDGRVTSHFVPRIFLFLALQLPRIREEWGPGDGTDMTKQIEDQLVCLLSLLAIVALEEKWASDPQDPIDPRAEEDTMRRIGCDLARRYLASPIDHTAFLRHLRLLTPTVKQQLRVDPIPPYSWHNDMVTNGSRYLHPPWQRVELSAESQARLAAFNNTLVGGEAVDMRLYRSILDGSEVTKSVRRETLLGLMRAVTARRTASADFDCVAQALQEGVCMCLEAYIDNPYQLPLIIVHAILDIIEAHEEGERNGKLKLRYWHDQFDLLEPIVADDPLGFLEDVEHLYRNAKLDPSHQNWERLRLGRVNADWFPSSYLALLKLLGLSAWRDELAAETVEHWLQMMKRAWMLDRLADETFTQWSQRQDIREHIGATSQTLGGLTVLIDKLGRWGVCRAVTVADKKWIDGDIPGWVGVDRTRLNTAVEVGASSLKHLQQLYLLQLVAVNSTTKWCRSAASLPEFEFDVEHITSMRLLLQGSSNVQAQIATLDLNGFFRELGAQYVDAGRLFSSFHAAYFTHKYDQDSAFDKFIAITHTDTSLAPMRNTLLNIWATTFSGSASVKQVSALRQAWIAQRQVHTLLGMIISFATVHAYTWDVAPTRRTAAALVLCWAGWDFSQVRSGQNVSGRSTATTRMAEFFRWLRTFTGFQLGPHGQRVIESNERVAADRSARRSGVELQLAAFVAGWAPQLHVLWYEDLAPRTEATGYALVDLVALYVWAARGDLTVSEISSERLSFVSPRVSWWWGCTTALNTKHRPRPELRRPFELVTAVAECGVLVRTLLRGEEYACTGDWSDRVREALQEGARLSRLRLEPEAAIAARQGPESVAELMDVAELELWSGAQALWQQFSVPGGRRRLYRPDPSASAFARMMVVDLQDGDAADVVKLVVLTQLETAMYDKKILTNPTVDTLRGGVGS